jgi:Rrf2 family protein
MTADSALQPAPRCCLPIVFEHSPPWQYVLNATLSGSLSRRAADRREVEPLPYLRYHDSVFRGITAVLTKTSETAIQTLLYLIRQDEHGPLPPIRLARILGASPSYLAKVCTLLVKADLLRAHRGTKGGVTFIRDPKDITLLEVVEVCQGRVLADYCQEWHDMRQVCAFHEAMNELHNAIVHTLERWTLADLAARPQPAESLRGAVSCRMACAHEGTGRTRQPAVTRGKS